MSSITALQNSPTDTAAIAALQKKFAAHKQAFFKHPFPDVRERRAHLYALADALLSNRARIREALQTDFGAHPAAAADLAEIGGPLAPTLAAAQHVHRWLRPGRRSPDLLSFGPRKAHIALQPTTGTGLSAPSKFS